MTVSMRKCLYILLLTLGTSMCFSCADDDEVYPNIVTEMLDVVTDSQGQLSELVLDDDSRYSIADVYSGYKANARYRALCGFVPEGSKAKLYQMTGAHILRDSTLLVQKGKLIEPTNVHSVWRTSRYINLHLAPLTQGGTQYWGFVTDSIIETKGADGQTSRCAYLSLYHRQNGDPTSYTADVYASIPLDSIKGFDKKTDEVTLCISTFSGSLSYSLTH